MLQKKADFCYRIGNFRFWDRKWPKSVTDREMTDRAGQQAAGAESPQSSPATADLQPPTTVMGGGGATSTSSSNSWMPRTKITRGSRRKSYIPAATAWLWDKRRNSCELEVVSRLVFMTLYSPEKVGSIKLYSSVFQQITPHNVAEKRRGGQAAWQEGRAAGPQTYSCPQTYS